MALRRCQGFTRYALSLQYHGQYHLGVSYQGPQNENCLIHHAQHNNNNNDDDNNNNNNNTSDLRGLQSIEGRLLHAFHNLVGSQNVENVKISSRTDRGVHALRNTCHVDIRKRKWKQYKEEEENDAGCGWDPIRILHGLNYHLCRQPLFLPSVSSFYNNGRQQQAKRYDLQIISAVKAPLSMENKFHQLPLAEQQRLLQQQEHIQKEQPKYIDWNARFSATKRTYTYRILYLPIETEQYNIPFEHDRAWILSGKKARGGMLNVKAMQEAALYMVGKDVDYTTFRGRLCQRSSPLVNVLSVDVTSTPYYANSIDFYAGGGTGSTATDMTTTTTTTTTRGKNHDFSTVHTTIEGSEPSLSSSSSSIGQYQQPTSGAKLIHITVSGESFVYRQVRNMVGCLVDVGRGKLQPKQVSELLQKKDRSLAPAMAPAHGLFLVDVEHGDFYF